MKAVGYYLNFIRSNKGRETLIMADVYYYFYYTACFNDLIILDEVFNQICLSDYYIYGKSLAIFELNAFNIR
jgi:hypothetical protein